MPDAEIARFDALIAAAVAAEPELDAAASWLRTAPRIGPLTAALPLAWLPELGRLGRREIAALAGLAPWDNGSGRSRGKRRIRGGRAEVRRALHSVGCARPGAGVRCAPTASGCTAGKPKKLPLVASARRLLTMLNAMRRDGTDYRAVGWKYSCRDV